VKFVDLHFNPVHTSLLGKSGHFFSTTYISMKHCFYFLCANVRSFAWHEYAV